MQNANKQPVKLICSVDDCYALDFSKCEYKISNGLNGTLCGKTLYSKLHKRLQRARCRFINTGKSKFEKKSATHQRQMNKDRVRRFRAKLLKPNKSRTPKKQNSRNNRSKPQPLKPKLAVNAQSKNKLSVRSEKQTNKISVAEKKETKKRYKLFVLKVEDVLHKMPLVVREIYYNRDRPLEKRKYV